MPWTDDPSRFVVPAGMSEGEAFIVRRQLQIMARLDTILELVKINKSSIDTNARAIAEQEKTLQQILQAVEHFKSEFMERAVGDTRRN